MIEKAIGDILTEYGAEGLFVALAALAAFYFIKARAKTSEVNAEEDRVKAQSIETLNHTTRSLIEQFTTAYPAISTSLIETAASQKTTAEALHAQALTMNQMLLTLKENTTNATTSGAAIATQMEVSNKVQEVAQATASTVSATITAGQTELLTAIATFTDQLKILTEQIKESGEVDDKLRADILAQMTQINAFLTRSEAKEEKEKEQDEKPNEAKTTQTTIELKGEVVGVLNTADLGSDKPSGGTDK